MKKIMFNDKYALTAAVLAGTKSQTRRIIEAMPKEPQIAYGLEKEAGYVFLLDGYTVVAKSRFKIGEVVAVSQKYFDVWNYIKASQDALTKATIHLTKGWDNKMFIRAELMPHQIEITNIRVQRLQDISEDDCLAEGIMCINSRYTFIKKGKNPKLDTPRKAYAELIDKISGKGTWEKNPWVFVYNFKLIK